jgi:hypothetical protein
VRVTVDSQVCGVRADEVRRRLWDQDPRVLVLAGDADTFWISPDTLSDAEAAALVPLILGALEEHGR